jgi:hypothetical protein
VNTACSHKHRTGEQLLLKQGVKIKKKIPKPQSCVYPASSNALAILSFRIAAHNISDSGPIHCAREEVNVYIDQPCGNSTIFVSLPRHKSAGRKHIDGKILQPNGHRFCMFHMNISALKILSVWLTFSPMALIFNVTVVCQKLVSEKV